MPANLPPQYFEAEKQFRQAKAPEEKIAALEEMLAIMPKHKGTDHLRAELRARIAKLTQVMDKKAVTHRASTVIPREGAAQVAVIGLPNAGKSQLVAKVTNATPTVADYPFTTHIATPGMMEFENVKIQLIDTPPLVPQTIEFWLTNLLRRADALLIMVDLSEDPLAQTEAIVEQLGKMRVRIIWEKSEEGETGIIYQKKALVAGNKSDLPQARQNYRVLESSFRDKLPVVAISARDGSGLEDMKRRLYETLDVIRVYTKVPGGKPDFTEPIALPRGSKLEDAAAQIHKDFLARLKYARLWGSGKFDGVMVKRDHVLQDGDIIELHI
ncbi:MAG: 50S ribosome-binding GTPase [Chloroflexi bacterium]|nr:50S ribosome-binding GTPase [Chloroflexota bacterium]